MNKYLLTQPCPQCGFKHQCICDWVPTLRSSLHIALLTHENELNRETNTGKLLSQTLPNCQVHVWQRKHCPESLQVLLDNESLTPILLFPSEQSMAITPQQWSANNHQKPLFIILDSTWQEAKKMLRKSAWLSGIAQGHFNVEYESQYALRRNQQKGHLCTCEVGIQLLESLNESIDAQSLQDYFSHYVQVFHADRQGQVIQP